MRFFYISANFFLMSVGSMTKVYFSSISYSMIVLSNLFTCMVKNLIVFFRSSSLFLAYWSLFFVKEDLCISFCRRRDLRSCFPSIIIIWKKWKSKIDSKSSKNIPKYQKSKIFSHANFCNNYYAIFFLPSNFSKTSASIPSLVQIHFTKMKKKHKNLFYLLKVSILNKRFFIYINDLSFFFKTHVNVGWIIHNYIVGLHNKMRIIFLGHQYPNWTKHISFFQTI